MNNPPSKYYIKELIMNNSRKLKNEKRKKKYDKITLLKRIKNDQI